MFNSGAPEDDAPLELESEAEQRQRIRAGGPDAGSSTPATSPPRRLPRLLAGLVLLVAAVEVGATLIQHYDTPQPRDWKAADLKLRALRNKGEPLLFAPRWVAPLARERLHDQVELELQLLSDVDRYRRVFEVSVRGARHPWLEGETPAQTWPLGEVTVSLFERKSPPVVTYDFTRKIRQAQVSRIGGKVTRCPWNAAQRRFRCDPVQSWNWVGPHLAEVGHRPYRCIFAHPVDRQVIRISFPAATLGTTLVGYTGIDDFENRKRADAEVLLRVLVGPREVGAIRHQNHWDWHRFTLDTREMAGQTHPVSFEVTSERAYARTFCFAAEARSNSEGRVGGESE